MCMEFVIRPFAIAETEDPHKGELLWTVDVKIDGLVEYSSRRYVSKEPSKLQPVIENLALNTTLEDLLSEFNWIVVNHAEATSFTFEVQQTIGTSLQNPTIEQIGILGYCVVAKDKDHRIVYRSKYYGSKDDQDLYLLATACQERRERCNPTYWNKV